MKKFNIILNSILLLLILVIMILIKPLKIISSNGILIILGVLILILLLCIYVYFKINNNKIYLVLNILSSILLISSIFVSIFLTKTVYFINATKNNNQETHSYYLLVLKDNNLNNYKDLKGTIGTNISIPKFIENDINNKFKYYKDETSIESELLNNKLESILVSDVYYTIIKDTNSNFYKKVKVLKIFEETQTIELNNNQKSLIEPFILYLSGIDTVGNIEITSRTDVNILFVVNPKNNKILLLNIPRDYYVMIPGTTGYKDKLTHTGIYGISTSISTIENLLGIEIDYYLRVNFNTVVNLVDAIGGIDIYSDIAFWTSDNNYYFNQGVNHVNGRHALAFSRERYIYQEGDRHRGRNQQEVIKGIIQALTTKEELLINYLNILDNLDGKFQTNFDLNNLGYYVAKQLKDKANWTVDIISLNGIDSFNYTYSCPYQKLYVMEPDFKTVTDAKNEIDKIIIK